MCDSEQEETDCTLKEAIVMVAQSELLSSTVYAGCHGHGCGHYHGHGCGRGHSCDCDPGFGCGRSHHGHCHGHGRDQKRRVREVEFSRFEEIRWRFESSCYDKREVLQFLRIVS